MADVHGRNAWFEDVLLVYRREIRARMLTKGYAIGLVISSVILVAMVAGFSSSSAPTTPTVALCGAPVSSFGPAPQGVRTRHCADASTAREETRTKRVAAAVMVRDHKVTVLVRGDTPQQAESAAVAMGRAWATTAALRDQHVDTARLQQSIARTGPHVTTVGGTEGHDTKGLGAAIGMVIVLFAQVVGQGASIAQGVVEEKSTRVVEVLLSTLTPIRLMVGKVAGIGTAALTQVAVLAATVGGMHYVAPERSFTLPPAAALISGVGWFLLTFALFAFIFAAAGSLVSRPEELQSVLTPVMLLAMGPMVVAATAGSTLDSSWVQVLRYIPPFSGVLMPLMTFTGQATHGQQLLAVGVAVLATAACAWLGARVYSNSILRIGAKVGWKQALAAA
ncbi:ABC transporter permease [Streptomyces sp. NPDC006385]|uniref:ABC transporter permease n=1 Tax=Streptomyces sp. NPDC006385 TaxID=3156761 RepID=UPI0033B61B76